MLDGELVFDILAAGGRHLRPFPYDDRHRILEQTAAGWSIRLSAIDATDDVDLARRWFDELPGRGIEGLIAEREAQPYRGGNCDWDKVKRLRHLRSRRRRRHRHPSPSPVN